MADDPFLKASRSQRRGCGWPKFRATLDELLDDDLLDLLDSHIATNIATSGATHAAILKVLADHGIEGLPSRKILEAHRNGSCSCD